MDYNLRTRKRGKGWQYTLSYKVGGEWRTKSKQGYPKEADAKRAGQALARDLSDFVPSVSISPTFRETALLSHADGRKSKGTVESYNSYLQAYKNIHDMKMDEITYKDIAEILQAYQAFTKTTKKGTERVHKFNSLLAVHRYGKMVFNFAVKKLRIVQRNVFDDYTLVAPKQSDVRPVTVLTVDEIKALVEQVDNPNIRTAVAIIGLCGLRVSEAIAVTRADIQDGMIVVSHQLDKGDLYADLKTANSYRTVKIPPYVRALVNSMPLRLDGRVVNISANSVNVFLNKHNLVSHHLRHSYATNLIGMGIDFKTAADMIGDTVEMVMSTYAHVNADMRKSAEDKIMENF